MIGKEIQINDIITFLDEEVIVVYGNTGRRTVDNVASLAHTNEKTLDWVNSHNSAKQAIAERSIAKVIVVDSEVVYSDIIKKQGKIQIVVKNPRRAMAKIIAEFFLERPMAGIHPSAIIEHDAVVDKTATIGAGCYVGSKCNIGKNTVLRPNVVLYDRVSLGDNCLIQAGAVIGTDGLGCEREDDGRLIKFPHLGGVCIGNNVEIGANCQIARGVFDDTVIMDGCKINGMSFVAHNSELQENVWITGDTMLCGSAHVGKNATIFSNVIVRDQTSIGASSVIGMGAVVTKDVPAGEVWYGAPAHKK